MRLEELRSHLYKRPFQPVRVSVSDGSYYDVRHPDFLLVSHSEIVIGLDPAADGVPERNAYVDPVHITRIDPLNGGRTRGAVRRRKRGS